MAMKKRVATFHVKSIESDGTFEGYASVFGNVDYYRDVVMPGAFTRTLQDWKQKDNLPPCLWSHNAANPIGQHTAMAEDAKGLQVKGRLLIDDIQQARETHALMKAKVVRGMSIGYDIFEDGWDYDADNGILKLTALDLWENSICTFPANDQALVTEVKDMLRAGEMPSVRMIEKSLREQMGFSKSQAAAFASGGYAALTRGTEGSKSTLDGATPDEMCDVLCKAIAEFDFKL